MSDTCENFRLHIVFCKKNHEHRHFFGKIFRVVKFKDSVCAWVIYRKDVEQVNNFRTVFMMILFTWHYIKHGAVFYDDSFDMALHKTRTVFT